MVIGQDVQKDPVLLPFFCCNSLVIRYYADGELLHLQEARSVYGEVGERRKLQI